MRLHIYTALQHHHHSSKAHPILSTLGKTYYGNMYQNYLMSHFFSIILLFLLILSVKKKFLVVGSFIVFFCTHIQYQ